MLGANTNLWLGCGVRDVGGAGLTETKESLERYKESMVNAKEGCTM